MDRVICLTLEQEADRVAQELFGKSESRRINLTERLLKTCRDAADKDFLLIHNPGGWGGASLEHCLLWERSVVQGVKDTIARLGYSYFFMQYLRSGNNGWTHFLDLARQAKFFFQGQYCRVDEMAAELRFIRRNLKNTKVLMIGVSQGAAFSNAVMRQLGKIDDVYSVELGTFFPHMPRRIVTERTLVLDSNGIVPDPVAQRNLKAGARAYITAPFRWVRYRLQGRPEKFTYCINVPGHDYNWEYPEVHEKIIQFIETKFGWKNKPEVGL